MNRLVIAQYVALGATGLSIVGALLGGVSGENVGTIIMTIGFFSGLVSYILGGLGTAIKMAGGIAKWGWGVVPFPYDIVTCALTFFFSIIVLIFLPIVPIRKAYKQRMCYE